MNNKGFTIIETILALSILAIVLIPLSAYIPNVFRTLNDIYTKNRLVFIADTVSDYYLRWAHEEGTDLDAADVEAWTFDLGTDFVASDLGSVTDNIASSIPVENRVHIEPFNITMDNAIGIEITAYYDSDLSLSLTVDDKHRVKIYTLLSEHK
jgi:prepilin-type N-terminal cleavage/methylation domain-containing protein